MIRLDKVTVAPGGQDLLKEVDWHIRPKDRIGLVGRNGTGKTSILRAILGEHHIDNGRITRRNGLKVGYLPQHAVSGSVQTVWDEVQTEMHEYHRLKASMEAAEQALSEGIPGSNEALGEATEAFRIAEGFSIESRIGGVLSGLGFSTQDWHRRCDAFSGGWQMRIALARLLLAAPDLAVLDEPTNHLDILARTWLAQFLAAAPYGTLIVSHDRHLLDNVCTRIVEIRNKTLHHYTGNYSYFLTERDLRASQHESAYQRQQDKIAHLEKFVDRFGAKATKAKQAQSRKKQLEKIDRLDAPERAGHLPKLRLAEPPPSDHTVMELKNATLGWEQGTPILKNVSIVLERGMRVGVLGANGCGKTTLLRSLWGRLSLLSGLRKPGQRVRMGVFTQDLAAELPLDESALEWISGSAPSTPPEKIRSILGAMGLHGDMALRQLGACSGGERARVALAAIAASPYNVLLLDEPTNHLDTETIDALIEGLKNFEGTLILVSHDRYFIESLASHVLILQDGEAHLREGVSPEDFQLKARAKRKEKNEASRESYEARKKQQREMERKKKRITQIEERVQTQEAEVEALNETLMEVGGDYKRAQELGDALKTIETEIEALYSEWETLEQELAEA